MWCSKACVGVNTKFRTASPSVEGEPGWEFNKDLSELRTSDPGKSVVAYLCLWGAPVLPPSRHCNGGGAPKVFDNYLIKI